MRGSVFAANFGYFVDRGKSKVAWIIRSYIIESEYDIMCEYLKGCKK